MFVCLYVHVCLIVSKLWSGVLYCAVSIPGFRGNIPTFSPPTPNNAAELLQLLLSLYPGPVVLLGYSTGVYSIRAARSLQYSQQASKQPTQSVIDKGALNLPSHHQPTTNQPSQNARRPGRDTPRHHTTALLSLASNISIQQRVYPSYGIHQN
ncbi:hypothetical protein BKA64DRAFT_96544 [Cadophora sp. MPI-SDFR-AT-0126]|nr:hypothetical protein BKA64DRAFT_96544 [Leotiomycetes sp. MPI-SDFR-AT-0126]